MIHVEGMKEGLLEVSFSRKDENSVVLQFNGIPVLEIREMADGSFRVFKRSINGRCIALKDVELDEDDTIAIYGHV